MSFTASRSFRRYLATILVVAGCAAVSAQSANDLLNPSTISFEHDGKNVTGFVAYVSADSGLLLRLDLGPLRPDDQGRIVASVPSLPPGDYSIEIAAYNAAGESPHVPASPKRFRVTAQRARPADLTQTSRQPDTAPPSPENKAPKDAAAKKDEAKPKRGFLGKFYGAIVGSDEEDGGK
jgi:hypothetical protein